MKFSTSFDRLFLFVLIAVILVSCSPKTVDIVPPDEDTPVAEVDVLSENQDWDNREIFRPGLIVETQGVLAELPGASVYKLDFTISDDRLKLDGHQAVKYTNREGVSLDEIYFQLFPNASGGGADLSNVKIDDQKVTPEYLDERTVARLPLSPPLEPGVSTIIEFDFSVDMAEEMGGNFGTFGYFDEILVMDEFYPVIPVYDESGWNYKVPSVGDLTYLDASFYLVSVTAPSELKLIASGYEVENKKSGKQQTVTYAAGPARDFYLAASDKFTSISKQVGETTINSYAFSNRKDAAELALDIASEALKIFNRRYGVYPYSEFDVVSTPMMALGIEYPGIVGIAVDLYDLDQTIYGMPAQVVLESTVAHEVGHQWFYNMVGNSQISEPWLDEAVVQYITGIYYKDRYGNSAFESYSDSWFDRWGRVDQEMISVGMPSESYDDYEYSSIVYGRGPIFVNALAEEMGQNSFDEFMIEYFQTNLWGIGTEQEFRDLAEQHCSCDLSSLFAEWLDE
ncbi:M1 family metallopeptidase [Chloroflexota bacterium]